MEDIKKLFLDHSLFKTTFGLIMVFVSWSFNGEYKALVAVSFLITTDFVTGTYWALKTNVWNSQRSTSGVGKVARFFLFMLIARMVDKAVPLPFASPMMDSYIAITEAGSILENFSKLGYPVPTFLVTKLKTFYDNKQPTE